MAQETKSAECDSCREAGMHSRATVGLHGCDEQYCQECAETIRQGIHDGTMGGNPSLDGQWLEIEPL